jgi:hypothetical protein
VRSFKSWLFDAADTDLYDGADPHAEVLRFNGTTYVLATTDDNSGPTATLFRPNPNGALKPACYHRAAWSSISKTLERIDTRYPCPDGAVGERIFWKPDKDDATIETATIYLPEWGGIRPVLRETLDPNRPQFEHVHVGEVDADSVAEIRYVGTVYVGGYDDWAPLKVVDSRESSHDSSVLLLTPAGPYIQLIDSETMRSSSAPPLGSVYYRIVDNGLTEVCRITEEVVPPPGYPIPDYVNNPERFD